MPRISIILPTFNEAANIVPLINTIHAQLKGFVYEILVVDDQSPDGTAEVVRDLQDSTVRVIERHQDHGYAKSIRCGIEESTGDILILMDSDFNHNPTEIPGMLALIEHYDCVCASRFLKGGRMSPAWRSWCSRIFNMVIRWSTGGRMTDNLYGFFVIKRAALARCSYDDIFYGFGDYGIRLLYYLQKEQLKILEVPSVYGQRRAGQGNKNFIKTFYQYFVATIRLVKER